MPKTISLRSCLEQSNVITLEGFLDSIKTFFDKKIYIKNDDIKYGHLEKEIIETIKKNFINEKWVSNNIKNNNVKISTADLKHLIVDFKLLNPDNALDLLYKKYKEAYAKYLVPLKKFNSEQQKALDIIESFYNKNKDANKVEAFGIDLINKIQVPKIPDFSFRYSKDFSNKIKQITENNSEITYSLSVDEIIKLSNKIIELITVVEQNDYTVVRGSGMDSGFWISYPSTSNDYDPGEKIRLSELGDFFYFQALPQKLNDVLYMPLWDLRDAIYVTLKIIIKSLNIKHDFSD